MHEVFVAIIRLLIACVAIYVVYSFVVAAVRTSSDRKRISRGEEPIYLDTHSTSSRASFWQQYWVIINRRSDGTKWDDNGIDFDSGD